MNKPKENSELPPFFRTWTQVYMAVAGCLIFFVLFLYWFSKLYN